MRFVLVSRFFKTISFRLMVLYGLIFALCMLALLVAVYVTTTAALRSQLKSEIQNQLATMVEEATTDGVETIVQDIKERSVQTDGSLGYYFLADKSGQKLAGNLDQVATVDGWRETSVADIPAGSLNGAPDDDHQIWAEGRHLPDGSYLLVGQDAFQLLSAQEAIVQSFAWSAAVAIFLAALAGLLVSRGFLSRIDRINATSQSIMDGHLKTRIPVTRTHDELDQLSGNLNKLFDSNEALLESLKHVGTNIAHDLRTPLSRLRQGLEEARLGAVKGRVPVAALDDAVAESDQLLATFAALLRIAQIESGSRKSGFSDTNVSDVFARVVEAYRAVAEDQGKTLDAALEPNFRMRADSDLLLQMVANLTENAIRHTPEGTRIVLTLGKDGHKMVATVSDNGPGIPADLREKVFQQFYRVDTARATSGNGLGLSLVAAIAKLHGIAIELRDNDPGLVVCLTFHAVEM